MVTVTGPVIVEPHSVRTAALVAVNGPVTAPPLIQSEPPACTFTGPTSLPPLETQTDWPFATVNGPVLLVVMHACVKPTEIVTLFETVV